MNAEQLTEAAQPYTKRLRARKPAVRSADVLVRSKHTEECRPAKPASAAESHPSGSCVFSHVVAQTFLSAGSGDFPVPSSRTPRRPTELESSVNPHAGKPALQAARTS